MQEINYIEIEKYLQGELTTAELEVFEKKLKTDTNFADEVKLYQEISNTLSTRASNQKEENDLRNTLEDIARENKKQELINNKQDVKTESAKPKVFNLQQYAKYLVAASVVIFATLLLFNNGKPTYTNFVNHQNMDLIVRGDSVSTFVKVQDAFNSKNYVLAEKELRTVLLEDKTKVELQLYLGICLLEQDKFELAESIFEKIAAGNSIYKNKATWYLALSKLKQEDYENSTNFAKLLPKDAEDYDNAQKLLSEL